MEAIWPASQGYPTSSGSGAGRLHGDEENSSWTNNASDFPDALDEEMALMGDATTAASSDLKPGERFNHKVAPSFDGIER